MVCKSKKKGKPKPPKFPPEAITVVLSLNWDDPLEGPQNWLGSIDCTAGGTGAPTWAGSLVTATENVQVIFTTADDGKSPGCTVDASLPKSSQALAYGGNGTDSVTLVPFVSGPFTITGSGIERPSTASGFG